ncbi:DNA helicase, putative (plasmid) [Gloeothece citriformis PCC 7424]|uniref:DNA helicase, putative n=1 Tax=Gloeothece citriformis (strain PCC 7424) TaxID=65393 RepID=B7KM70_GLOC7|nr:AAA family ATPase [Gloeothece citriformis]ACK73892.1 DNA helicase, putative [Gloeothece citriformis PCC 7424]
MLQTSMSYEGFHESSHPPTQLFYRFQFPLTKQQRKALFKLWQFVHSDECFFLVKGYAGTGKSTIIFALLAELQRLGSQIVLCAPTNKAVNILSAIAVSNNVFIPTMTIHQLLGLGVRNLNGEKVLTQTGPSSLHLYNLVILDECSMVNRELWKYIQAAFEQSFCLKKRQLIAMGDPAQLNPIGELSSPSFSISNRVCLNEVVRQGQSPLLDFITGWRTALSNKELLVPTSMYDPLNKQGAFKVGRDRIISYGIRKIERYFDKDPDRFRILCYSNIQVGNYNRRIRQAIYGSHSNQFIPGERLITKSPVVAPDGKTILLPTSTEFTVTGTTPTQYYGYQAWALTIACEGGTKQIYTLDKNEENRFQKTLQSLLEKAKANPYFWRKYYQFKEDIFAQVTNCYALTVHNSQGSTFTEGAVDGDDIHKRLYVGEESRKFKEKEFLRLWYVASSRFRKRLLFCRKSA